MATQDVYNRVYEAEHAARERPNDVALIQNYLKLVRLEILSFKTVMTNNMYVWMTYSLFTFSSHISLTPCILSFTKRMKRI